MNFQVKKLGPGDIPLMQYVGRATYEPYYAHVWKAGGVDWYMEKCFGTATLERELSDPGTEYLIFSDDAGQIIGFLKLILQKPTPDGSVTNALYLEKIYLMPASFRKGAGQVLIGYALERARRLGREAVWLEVMKTGPVPAYERSGFQNIGTTHFGHELLKEEERDGWVMLLRL